MFRSLLKWSLLMILCIGVPLLLLEVGGRVFMIMTFKTGWNDFSGLRYHYYNEILLVENDKRSLPKDHFSILLLGGSVLHPNNGIVAEEMRRQLSAFIDPSRFWIHNGARPGHSSMDSYLKTQILKDEKFDVVIFYHGINEVRANNCPAEMFREDYSHYRWYDEVHNAFDNGPEKNHSVIPFLLRHMRIVLKDKVSDRNYVPLAEPIAEWMDNGSILKTPKCFERNLSEVHTYAKRTEAAFIGLTFAHHLDPNYTREAYEAKTLSYNRDAKYSFAIEMWGKPANVVNGIRAHNAMMRSVAEQEAFQLYDMDSALSGKPNYFDDICHFSDSGAVEFARQLTPILLQIAKDRGKYPKKS